MLTGTLHSSLWQAHSSTHGMHSPDIDLSDPFATVQVHQYTAHGAPLASSPGMCCRTPYNACPASIVPYGH